MTRAFLWPARAQAIAAAAVVGLGVFAVSASADPPGSSELRFVLKTARFENRLSVNCDLFFSGGSGTQGGVASADGLARGAFSLARRSGEAYIKSASWQVERLPLPGERGTMRSTSFIDLGIALQRNTVFLTGRIVPGPVLIAASRRVKLAVIRGAKLSTGPLLDRRHRPVTGTLGLFASGKLKMLPAMSRALEAQRCKGPKVRLSRHIDSGYPLGQFSVGLLPGTATGLAGEAAITMFAQPTDDAAAPITVEASGGSTLKSDGHLAAPVAAGAGVPLRCIHGESCAGSGTVHIGGGFDLVAGGRRTSVANLAVAIAGDQETITGTVDGAPVTVAVGVVGTEPDFTSEFDQRAGAALGEGMFGAIRLDTTFTSIGPAG